MKVDRYWVRWTDEQGTARDSAGSLDAAAGMRADKVRRGATSAQILARAEDGPEMLVPTYERALDIVTRAALLFCPRETQATYDGRTPRCPEDTCIICDARRASRPAASSAS